MYVLKIQVNQELPVVGGAEDLGVLSATVSGVGKLGPLAYPDRPEETFDFHVRLGGLTSRAQGVPDEHLDWMPHRELQVGDRVTIQLLEADAADPVLSGKAAKQKADDERAYFEHCKAAYLDLRHKYENEG